MGAVKKINGWSLGCSAQTVPKHICITYATVKLKCWVWKNFCLFHRNNQFFLASLQKLRALNLEVTAFWLLTNSTSGHLLYISFSFFHLPSCDLALACVLCSCMGVIGWVVYPSKHLLAQNHPGTFILISRQWECRSLHPPAGRYKGLCWTGSRRVSVIHPPLTFSIYVFMYT